jgi:hypothetical protein
MIYQIQSEIGDVKVCGYEGYCYVPVTVAIREAPRRRRSTANSNDPSPRTGAR